MSDTRMQDLLRQLAPRPGRKPLLPELTPQQELALLCRVLYREGYDDHIAGHITLRLADGTQLVNPWELTWEEVAASDIMHLDAEGRVIAGEWNVTPAIYLHTTIHAQRPDVHVIIHNHARFGTVWADMQRVPPVLDQTGAQVDGEIVLYNEYAGTVNQSAQAAACADALGSAKWALLANHGVLVVAGSVRQAHLRALTLEWRSRQAWYAEAAGGGVPMPSAIAEATGAMIDGNGFPFLWEAMARREIRLDASVLE